MILDAIAHPQGVTEPTNGESREQHQARAVAVALQLDLMRQNQAWQAEGFDLDRYIQQLEDDATYVHPVTTHNLSMCWELSPPKD